MRKSAEGKSGWVTQPHKASHLCWAARLLSLGYGLFVAIYALGAGPPIVIDYASRGEIEESMFALLNWLPFFIPLVLAVIAWRWHLVGGTLVTAVSVAFYVYFTLSSGTQWIVYLYMLPIPVGGLLHLVAWYKEKQTDQVTQPMEAPEVFLRTPGGWQRNSLTAESPAARHSHFRGELPLSRSQCYN